MVLACLVVAGGLLTSQAGDAAAIEQVRQALAERVLDADQSTHEVRAFIDERVAPMPELSTADAWLKAAEKLRADALEKVVLRGEAAEWDRAPHRVTYHPALGADDYLVWKLSYEVVPGLSVPALLYVPRRFEGRIPVVLNVNGHGALGKAADYKQIRCINLVKRGMLVLNVEWFGMGQLATPGFRHGLINAVDLTGTSGIALHYEMLKRGIDLLLEHPSADRMRVAVTGLSGGGWQTIFIAGLDPRVTLANPVAGFADYHTRNHFLDDLGDSEQTPSDLATVLDGRHLVAMRAPRHTLLTFNAKDNCCYVADRALPPLLDAARPVYQLLGAAGRLSSHVNIDPGDHNYGADNRLAFYRALNDAFATPDASFPLEELPYEGELKTPDELIVKLPVDNLDFHTLAQNLAARLPIASQPPESPADSRWVEGQRQRLRAIVKVFEPDARRVAGQGRTGAFAIGTAWHVPYTELGERGRPICLALADAGRGSLAERAESELARGRRVVAIDPFYFGESRFPERDYLFAILVACVGERPLGLQVGQVLSVARTLRSESPDQPIALSAVGPRTSLIALIAAALKPALFETVDCSQPLGSLKHVIDDATDVSAAPELFCFGLLREFDVSTIAALCRPGSVVFRNADDRTRHAYAESKAVRLEP